MHNGYSFHRKIQKNNRCYVIHGCPATFTTINNKPTGVGRDHNHGSDVAAVAANVFIAGMKKCCRNEVEPVAKIHDEKLYSFRDHESGETTDELI